MVRITLLTLLLTCGLYLTNPSRVECADESKPVEAKVSFYRNVRPILQRNCSGCHQPSKAGGMLQLVTYEVFKKGGENGASFVPGDADH
ncbi:MAG: hypothetical protein FJ267_04350, partial [Planctomycetes bacterium]|nr:hypothetical protein [Planctomycetota bacterium]